MNTKFLTLVLLLFFTLPQFGQIAHNMVKLAQVDGLVGAEYTDIWGYTAPDGKEYAIIGSTKSVGIYDVTNCANPIFKFEFVDGLNNDNYWRDFKTYGNFAFGSADTGSEGLEVFNLTNINNITVTQITDHFLKAHNLYIDTPNARLYVAGARDANSSINNWIIIYDIANPATPVLLKKIRLNDLPGMSGTGNLYMHDIFVENNIAYISQGYEGFYVWDCTDVNNIQYLGHLNEVGQYNHSSWKHPEFTGDTSYFYVAEEAPAGAPIKVMRSVDNGSTHQVTLMKKFKNPLDAPTYTNPRPHNPFVKGNGLYISYYKDGVQVYDVTDPVNPYRAAYYDTYPNNNGLGYTGNDSGFNGAWGVYPFLSSGCILAADITYGLFTLRLKFPKIEVNGKIHVSLPGGGVIMRDSSNTCRLLSLDNSGNLLSSLVTGFDYDYKTDSADVEIITSGSELILTSSNNKKYKISIGNNGVLSSTAFNEAITNATTFNHNLFIDNKHKCMILRSPNNKRWRFGVKNNGSITTYRTSF